MNMTYEMTIYIDWALTFGDKYTGDVKGQMCFEGDVKVLLFSFSTKSTFNGLFWTIMIT